MIIHCLSCLIQSPPCREILALCDRLLPRRLDFTHPLFALRVSCILFYFFTSRKLVSQSAHTHVTFFFLVIDFPILFPAAVSRVSTNRSRWMKWPRMNCGKDSNAAIGTLTLTTCPSVCVCLPNLPLGSALAFTWERKKSSRSRFIRFQFAFRRLQLKGFDRYSMSSGPLFRFLLSLSSMQCLDMKQSTAQGTQSNFWCLGYVLPELLEIIFFPLILRRIIIHCNFSVVRKCHWELLLEEMEWPQFRSC